MKTDDSLPKKIARTATAAIRHSNAVEMVCLGGDSDDVKRMICALNEIDREADRLGGDQEAIRVETIRVSP